MTAEDESALGTKYLTAAPLLQLQVGLVALSTTFLCCQNNNPLTAGVVHVTNMTPGSGVKTLPAAAGPRVPKALSAAVRDSPRVLRQPAARRRGQGQHGAGGGGAQARDGAALRGAAQLFESS
jgi:hypothetical protein